MSIHNVMVMRCDRCGAEQSAPATQSSAFNSWMQLRGASWLRFATAVMPTDADYCPKCAEAIVLAFKPVKP